MNAGFQIGFHAIGDKGVQMAVDAFAAAERDYVGRPCGDGSPTRPGRTKLGYV